jgi:hypothetical protein
MFATLYVDRTGGGPTAGSAGRFRGLGLAGLIGHVLLLVALGGGGRAAQVSAGVPDRASAEALIKAIR